MNSETEIQENQETAEKTETVKQQKDPNKTNVIIVDFTAFSIRSEQVFFNKTLLEVKYELMDKCNTTVIHKLTEYDLTIDNKTETEVQKVIGITSRYEQNNFDLLDARRKILTVAKNVVNKRTMSKLMKEYEKLDAIMMNEKLD